MDKKPIYANLDALTPLANLVKEAGEALSDPTRVTSNDAALNETLAAVGGIGTGGAIGFAALYYGGVTGLSAAGITSGLATAGAIVGGGMAWGVAVIAAPAVVLGIGAYAVVATRNKKKLLEQKELLLQEALRKQNGIIDELGKTSEKNRQRADYLAKLNTLLQAAIRDLQSDLGRKAA